MRKSGEKTVFAGQWALQCLLQILSFEPCVFGNHLNQGALIFF